MMNSLRYSVGILTVFAAVFGIGLISCSDNPTKPVASKPSYKIAFISERDGINGIFVMDNSGSGLQRLTVDNAIGPSISWSPDGTRIAFTALHYAQDDHFEIYVVHADGSFQTQLTYSTHFMGEVEAVPIWSPDGSKIAFRSYREGNSDIFVMNSDGSNLKNVTHDSTYNYEPVWRPDGMGVTFVSASSNGDWREYRVYFSNTDGSVRNFEPAYPGLMSDSLCTLFWFPLGSTIGCIEVAQNGSMYYNICTNTPGQIVCNGAALLNGSDAVDHVTSPVWSPDGSRLAFISNVEGKGNIYVKTLEDYSAGPRKLTNSLTGDGVKSLVWSPDGTEMVFAADWTGNLEIYVMKADGTDVRQLTTSSGSGCPVCTKYN